MKRSPSSPGPRAGLDRIAALTTTTALALPLALFLVLPLSGTAAAAPPTTVTGTPTVPSASKPDGPIESSLSVVGTGALAAAGTIAIVRRHQRRSRGGRR